MSDAPETTDVEDKRADQDALESRFQATPDIHDSWDASFIVTADVLRDALIALRDEFAYNVLIDITTIDYLSHAQHDGERFAVSYNLKSLSSGDRIRLKVWVSEEEAEIVSVHDVWKNANWLEREAWDQYGVSFIGHPNQKRLLNHIDFKGHPLRKDFPVRKRQELSVNDAMLDELEARLQGKGYAVLEQGSPAGVKA